MLSYPELDHYEQPRQDPYLGLPDLAYGAAPAWPQGTGPRIAAYLRSHAQLEPLLKALAACPARVLLRIGEIEPQRLRPWLRPGFEIAGASVNLRLAAQQCDAYLTYGAHGTVAEMLLAGKPGVLWPDTVERWLVARRAEQLGAVVAAPRSGPFDAAAALDRVLRDASLRQAAEGFAARYGGQDRAAIPAALRRRLLGEA
jgi:UDP:flavonoid glycosyltransferase YjiC (YdhE family)